MDQNLAGVAPNSVDPGCSRVYEHYSDWIGLDRMSPGRRRGDRKRGKL